MAFKNYAPVLDDAGRYAEGELIALGRALTALRVCAKASAFAAAIGSLDAPEHAAALFESERHVRVCFSAVGNALKRLDASTILDPRRYTGGPIVSSDPVARMSEIALEAMK